MVCWVVEVALRYTCADSRSARKSRPTLTGPKLTPFNSQVKCYFTHPRNHWKWNQSQRGIQMSGKGKRSFGGSVLSVSIFVIAVLLRTQSVGCAFHFPKSSRCLRSPTHTRVCLSLLRSSLFEDCENTDREFPRCQVCLWPKGSVVGRVLGQK